MHEVYCLRTGNVAMLEKGRQLGPEKERTAGATVDISFKGRKRYQGKRGVVTTGIPGVGVEGNVVELLVGLFECYRSSWDSPADGVHGTGAVGG